MRQQLLLGKMNAEELARLVFDRGVGDGESISLVMPFLDGPKQLFFAILDLFMRGVVMISGVGSGAVALHEITEECYGEVSSRMLAIGIRCSKVVRDAGDDAAWTNMGDLLSEPCKGSLDRYRVLAVSRGKEYSLGFTVERPEIHRNDRVCAGNVHSR